MCLNPNLGTNETFLESMKLELNRLKSFDNYWSFNKSPKSLAEAGLFCLREADKVQCAFCKLILGNWKESDKPLRQHIWNSPKCPFLTGKTVLENCRQKAVPVCHHINSYACMDFSSLFGIDPKYTMELTCEDLFKMGVSYNVIVKTVNRTIFENLKRRKVEVQDKVKMQCKICFIKDLEIAFKDCGHTMSCSSCADKLKNCPICRKRILDRMATLLDDSITSLPVIPYLHPLFNKRNIFPLITTPPSAFDWYFKELPLQFKRDYESNPHCDLDTFFWETFQYIRDPLITSIRIYLMTIQASAFDSFIKHMEWLYHNNSYTAFVLPITRICNIMNWASKYSHEEEEDDEENHKIYEYHRHLVIVAKNEYIFYSSLFLNLEIAPLLFNTCGTLQDQLEQNAFNTIPITRISDLLKVCHIQQLLDYNSDEEDEDDVLFMSKRLNRPPVHRAESF